MSSGSQETAGCSCFLLSPGQACRWSVLRTCVRSAFELPKQRTQRLPGVTPPNETATFLSNQKVTVTLLSTINHITREFSNLNRLKSDYL